MTKFATIPQVLTHALAELKNSPTSTLGKWQGTDSYKNQVIHEAINYIFQVPMKDTIRELQNATKADQPWAEEHFQERVLGVPLNPGSSYRIWPYNNFKSGDEFLREGHSSRFSHSYMERYWPKYAGEAQHGDRKYHQMVNTGVWYEYGDLSDVVNLLKQDPNTRQAYLPVWHPEDTGAIHGQRVPCSIGYHFILRNNLLHCNYYIRSCDFYRHFKNDIYLTIRLVQWIMEKLGGGIRTGILTMHIGSFHLFKNDLYLIAKSNY